MPRGESFIDPREVLERTQHRLDLPTENIFLSFIREHNDQPGWEGIKEIWERERERGVLPILEKQTLKAISKNNETDLEQVRAFVNYLEERLAGGERKKLLNDAITDKSEEIRDYLARMINDYDLRKDMVNEFNEDLNILILSHDHTPEPLLRRMEIFIVNATETLNDLNAASRDQKKRDRATDLWKLQLSAQAIRDELLRRHFASPDPH